MTGDNEQEVMYRFGMFEQQVRELQQQIEAVERGIVDLNSLNFGLDELVGSTGKEIFAPFGKGIFVKAKLLSEGLSVDIGNGNLVKKSIPETKELIEEQIKKLGQIKIELENNLEQLGEELTKMMNDIQNRQPSYSHSHSHEHEHKQDCKCKEGEECDCGEDCECEEE
jgi:prefoldin alpha subunit